MRKRHEIGVMLGAGLSVLTLLGACGSEGSDTLEGSQPVDVMVDFLNKGTEYAVQRLLLSSCSAGPGDGTLSLVRLNGSGQLEYCPYENRPYPGMAAEQGNTIPDFSFSGYQGMLASGIPSTWPASVVVHVAPDSDSLDDAPRIQAAIDEVSAAPLSSGHRGVVLLAAGEYEVGATLRIRDSGVVLRGAGQGVDGTVLRFTLADGKDLIRAGNPRVVSLREAEDYDAQSGTTTQVNGALAVVNNLSSGDWLQYDNFDFTGVLGISFRMSGIYDGSTIQIRLGSPTGTLIGECSTPNTGGWNTYETFTCPVSPASGKKDLVVSFHRADAHGIGKLDYLRSRVWSEDPESRRKIAAPVPSGGTTLTVTDASPFSPGDKVFVLREATQAWIDDLTDPDGTATDWNTQSLPSKWTVNEYELAYERVVASISGNQLTLDVPLVQALNLNRDVSYVVKAELPRTSEVGIEHLRLESAYAHDLDEQHGRNAILAEYLENSWVRNVTGKHFWYSLVRLSGTRFVTVQDVSITEPKSLIQGSRRYSYSITGLSSMNLIQRAYASEGRHVHVMGARVPGPNVFLDSLSEFPYAEDGPHQRYATGVLYDNIKGKHGNDARVRNTSAQSTGGSGHGWTGAQVIFWNNESHGVWVASPPGAMNFALGTIGSQRSGYGPGSNGRFEDWIDVDEQVASHTSPRSLYLQQLQDRLGQAAVDRVVTREQTYRPIWDKLASWAGEPFLLDESFDAMPSGQSPGGWTVNSSGGTAQVAATTNKHLLLNDSSTAELVSASKTFASTSRVVQANFKVRFSSLVSGICYASLYSGGTEAIRLRTDAGGKLQIQNGTSYQDLQGISPNVWYSVRIVADPEEGKADTYVDGVLRQRQGSFKNAVASIDRIEFKTHTSGTAELSVDDVWVKAKSALLSEDFNAMASSSEPRLWTIDDSASAGAIIASVPSSSNKSMKLFDNSGSDAVSVTRGFAPSDSRVTIEQDVKFGAIGSYYIKSWGGQARSENLEEAIRIRASEGSLHIQEGTNYSFLGTYSPNVWYTIKVVAYPDLAEADVYVNDVQMGSRRSFKKAVLFLRQVGFATHSSGTGQEMYVDNLLVKN